MATVGNSYASLADLYKNMQGGEVTGDIIEMLSQINPILNDMPSFECNQGTTHKTTVRTGLPAATWRALYQGVQPSKSTNKQVTDATGMLESWSEVDSELVRLAGEGAGQFRLNEAQAFIQTMGIEWASTLFYGSEENEFTGLAPRFNEWSDDKEDGSAYQVIDAGGTGSDNTSIWMVVWSANTVHGLYPKGTMAGVERKDLGEDTADDGNGGKYLVMREQFKLHTGLSVRDYRYVVRIANVSLAAVQNGSLDLYSLMRKAYYRLYQRRVPNGNTAIYCNTDIMEALDAQATNNGTSDNFVRLTPMEVQGETVMGYRGVPIREVDALLNTEAVVPEKA
jgi:hypothetical protein